MAKPKHKAKPIRDIPEPESSVITDRMARNENPAPAVEASRRFSKKPACPKCGAFPVVTEQRHPSFGVYRCRECDFRFEDVR